MSSPKLRTEAAAAGNYPEKRFNQRERKLLQTVSNAVQAGQVGIASSDLTQTISAEGVTPSYAVTASLNDAGSTTAKIVSVSALVGSIQVTFDADPTGAMVQWIAVHRPNTP